MPMPEPLKGLVYEDDVLAPKDKIAIEYYGPNPFAVYPGLKGLIQVIFHARGQHIFETQFRWDITADPRPFFISMHLNLSLDRFTRLIVPMKIFGTQPSDPTKNGKLLVEIQGRITTTYPISTIWQRIFVEPFVWVYHHSIYNDVRRRYIQIGKEGIEKLGMEIRSTLNIMKRERLT